MSTEVKEEKTILQLCMEQVGFFKSRKIPVHTPGEVEYERAIANSNLVYRFARPACVLQPEHNSHIRIIITRAKKEKLPVRIKNGGHSYAGFSTINDGLLIDLLRMNKVDLDVDNMTITMQAGAQWGHAYKELINDHKDKLVVNGGRCPTVGVSGFILGGGLGPFTRSFGMGCETLLEATVITAKGEAVIVKRDNDEGKDKKKKDDLFWALCGAGGGNFGVLVELKMELKKLHQDEVVAGIFTWSPLPDEVPQQYFMDTMLQFYTADWPNDMTIDSTWICNLKDGRQDPAVRFLVYYNGVKETYDALINKHLGEFEPDGEKEKRLSKELKRRVIQEKSTRFFHETLVSQWSEETVRAFPTNPMYKIYTSFVFGNKESDIKEITAIIRDEMKVFRENFKGEQGLLQVTWIHCGGEASKGPSDASAYPWRKGVYHAYIMIEWQDKFLELVMRGFLLKMNTKLRPFSHSGRAAFINFPDPAFDDLKPKVHEDAYYGPNKERLRRIKAVWDGDNFFNWPQGIQLPSEAQEQKPQPQPQPQHDDGDEEYIRAMAMTDKIAAAQWETCAPPPYEALPGGVQGVNFSY